MCVCACVCVCVWGGGGVTMMASYILKQNKLKLNDDISQIESFLGVIQVFKSEMYVCLLEELIGYLSTEKLGFGFMDNGGNQAFYSWEYLFLNS